MSRHQETRRTQTWWRTRRRRRRGLRGRGCVGSWPWSRPPHQEALTWKTQTQHLEIKSGYRKPASDPGDGWTHQGRRKAAATLTPAATDTKYEMIRWLLMEMMRSMKGTAHCWKGNVINTHNLFRLRPKTFFLKKGIIFTYKHADVNRRLLPKAGQKPLPPRDR